MLVGETRIEKKATRVGPEAALKMARAAREVYAARGKKVVRFEMDADDPTDDALLRHILGRSGFMRAPSLRVGDVLVVGFNADLYDEVLG